MNLPPPDKERLMTNEESMELFDQLLESPGSTINLVTNKTESAIARERAKGQPLTISTEAFENLDQLFKVWVGSRMVLATNRKEWIDGIEVEVKVKINGKEEEGEVVTFKYTVPDGGNRGV